MFHDLVLVFTSSLIALFPIVNPIGNSFIVNSLIEDGANDEKHRNELVKKVAIYSLMLGLGCLLIGRFILMAFSLSIPIIQIGGGLMICKTAWELLSDDKPKKTNSEDKDKLANIDVESNLFYPITFPITMGSGSISVIFTLAANATVDGNLFHTALNYVSVGLAILVICCLIYVFLLKADKIVKRLGPSGNQVINKLIAFLTLCIGIQILVTGIFKAIAMNH